jgi:hypothetical protein
MIDKIMDYEMGNLTDDEIVELFQEMIDSGLVWQLQGSYARMAMSLIEEGYCVQD